MRVPTADLPAQYASLKEELDGVLHAVLASGRYVGGPEIAAFERAFAGYLGVPHAIGTSSGSTAVHAALRALDVGPGDEVIVPAYTFCATIEAVLQCGATPRICDVDDQGLLAPEEIESALTKHTRCILAVHLFGRCADTEGLRRVAGSRLLVEDAAQACGARGEALAGTVGAAGCFSFFPAKILGAAGDAGAVVTRDEALAERIRLLVNHGRRGRDESEIAGYNYRLDALQAAILRVKLPHLDAWLAERRRLAARYREAFAELPLTLPAPDPGHAYGNFCVQLEARDRLAEALAKQEIATAVHYRRPLHRQRAFASLPRSGPLPRAEHLADTSLCLPLYPELGERRQARVIDAVRAFFTR